MYSPIRNIAATLLCLLAPMAVAVSIHKPDPYLLERELTALLRELLAPFDPAILQQTTLQISEPLIEVRLEGQNINCSGFSMLNVTVFNPPMPLLSPEVKLVTRTSLHMSTSSYTASGTVNDQPVDAAGAAWIDFTDLVYEMTFDTDSFDSSTLELCVRHNTFHVELSAVSIAGEFEGLPEVSDNMNIYGKIMLFEVEQYINDNWQWAEDKLNGIFCR